MGHIITIDLVWSLTKVIETTVDILWYAEVIHVIDHDLKIWSHSRKRWKSNTTYHIDHTVQILIIAAIFSPPPSHVTNRLNNRIEVRAVFDTKEKKEEVLPPFE